MDRERRGGGGAVRASLARRVSRGGRKLGLTGLTDTGLAPLNRREGKAFSRFV